MKISYNTSPSGLNMDTGYGLAGYGIVTSMQRCGYKVGFKDATAPVEIAFCMPDDSEWSNPNAYHIQLTPWESTKLKPRWIENFNKCDEVWATSQWVADVYKAEGVIVPIHVYEHGIDSMWIPRRRKRGPVLRFIHVGEPAPRKGGQMALEAFRDVFGDRTDVSLTIKAWNHSNLRVYDGNKSIRGLPQDMYDNVTTLYNNLEREGMVNLYNQHHALVYPSMGEGFGLIPLESMATGMPTICTEVWAPYKRFLSPELALDSVLIDSAWPTMHPGQFYQPNYDDLCEAYRAVDRDYDHLAGVAFKNSYLIRDEYNWDQLTHKVFKRIEEMFS